MGHNEDYLKKKLQNILEREGVPEDKLEENFPDLLNKIKSKMAKGLLVSNDLSKIDENLMEDEKTFNQAMSKVEIIIPEEHKITNKLDEALNTEMSTFDFSESTNETENDSSLVEEHRDNMKIYRMHNVTKGLFKPNV